MQTVLVVDTNRRPLMRCSPISARKLLQEGQSAVLQLQPFTIVLKKREGGSDRVSNLTIGCRECHSKKSNRSLRGFLQGKPSLQSQIRGKAKKPLADASAVNRTGKEIVYRLATFDLPISCSPGGRAKFNRTLQGYPEGERRVRGFATADLVKAVVLQGKKKGTYSGRVAIRSSGSFCIDTPKGKVARISYRFCKHLQYADGYQYSQQPQQPRERRFLPRLKSQVSASSVL